jgi:hypothetical protein
MIAVLHAVGLGGCAANGDGSPAGNAVVEPAIDDATMRAMVAAHNERVADLRELHADGVIELRWVDEQGREHFEPQVNAKLWMRLPRRTALRAEKLGEVLFWLGSNDEGYWLFDQMGDETVLYRGEHGLVAAGAEEQPLLIRPLALVDLMGLTEVEPPAEGELFDRVIVENDLYVLAAVGAGGPMRIAFDPAAGGRAVRVESLGPGGEVMLASTLRRHDSVKTPDLSQLAWPEMPTLIDITDPAGRIAVKLGLSDMSVKTRDAVFDFDRLVEHFQPERLVEDGEPVSGVAHDDEPAPV